MAQSYQGPAALPRGSRVVLVVSKGPDPAPSQGQAQVPGVVGEQQGRALGQLQDAGFRARVINDYGQAKRGAVMYQVPRANVPAPYDSEVVLLVSSGKNDAEQGLVGLPEVIGQTQDEAVSRLQTSGFSAEVTTDYSPTVPAGIVMNQLPAPADLAAPQKSSSPWVWVAIIAALLIAGVAAFFLLRPNAGPPVAVPDVVGQTQADAVTALEDAGFVAEAKEAEDPGDAKEGAVVAQDPEAGTELEKGSTVVIEIAGAPKQVKVPDVVGLSEADATTMLEDAGLRANPRTKEDDSAKAGTVLSQSPSDGAEVDPGSRVDIVVAKAPAKPTQVKVPGVTGAPQAEAEQQLKDAGLSVTVVKNSSDSVTKGDVIAQLPTSGTLVAPDSEVVIVVSTGPAPAAEEVQVPDVMGESKADAESEVKAAGFKVQSVVVSATGQTPGYVYAQSPIGGTSAPKGSVVVLLVAQ